MLSMNLRQYPLTRLRRSRMQAWSRQLVAENQLSISDLIWPIFVIEGQSSTQAIPSMPGILRYTLDKAIAEVKLVQSLGIPAIALFPVVENSLKTDKACEACNPDNLMCRAIKAIKDACPDIGIIADVALDPYTSHGHDGLIENNEIVNDATIDILIIQALNQAKAGCDIIAPSDMQDGRIGKIRQALEENNYKNTLIMSYAAKYASHFYGPFRDAVGSKGNLLKQDKKTYQQDTANVNESLHEVAMDLQEGADLILIKPGLPYLDVIHRVKATFAVPTFAYQVSGEYAMIAAADEQGWLSFEDSMSESLLCCKRAGADAIFTYAAKALAESWQ